MQKYVDYMYFIQWREAQPIKHQVQTQHQVKGAAGHTAMQVTVTLEARYIKQEAFNPNVALILGKRSEQWPNNKITLF